MRKRGLALVALVSALPIMAALLVSRGASGQDAEMFVPGTFYLNCGGLTPALEFTHEDFQKGFSRTYTFPGTKYCELGKLGDRGGTLTLTYAPAKNAPLHAKLDYWEVHDCSDTEDEPRTARYSYVWSGDLRPTDQDPDGVFPAASYGESRAPVKVTVTGHCDDAAEATQDFMHVRVGLVSQHPETGDVYRTAYVLLRGDVNTFSEAGFAGQESEGEVEVAVTPKGEYDAWMPAGNVNASSEPGKQLTVQVTVHQKGDPASPGKAQIRFGFNEVSREKGVCLNWPAEGADTRPDLRLRFADPALGKPSPDGTSIETNGLVEKADLIVDAYDFGAWGTLRVSAKDKDKRDVIVKVRGKQTPDLYIPLDEDHNRIADSWQPDATRGKAADADDEHENGNEHDGDGLSLYEEYRGFVENGKRQQGNPAKKDFFVLDLVNSDSSRMGIALLEEAAHLEAHAQFTPEEFGLDRVINKYSSSGLRQHGVVLDSYDRRELDKGYSAAIGGPGPPRTVSKILISNRNINEPTRVPGEAYTDAAAEIAHELLHACSVWHHGEGDTEEVSWTKQSKDVALEQSSKGNVRVQVLREDGKAYEFSRADTIRVWLARERGQHSGDDTCLMRYHRQDAVYEASARFGSGELPVRYKADGGPIGLGLCRSALGTGVNAHDHEVKSASGLQMDLPRWGDAAEGRGDCFGQINVSDRAAP